MSGCSSSILICEQNKIIVSSVGNNLAYVYKQPNLNKNNNKNICVQLCEIHEPINNDERLRVQKNAGEIRKQKNDFFEKVFVRGRNYPGIEITRCIGNQVAKKIGVISEPEVFSYDINKQNDLFIIIATRNFFDLIEQPELYSILNSFNQKTVKQASDTLLKRIKNIQLQNEQIIEDFTFILYYF
ncbi:protein phosphatase, putative [Ichthyophthirius multifiliis]|uniref:Protein phosphatase, putative n=1 Tax=Ichthyophthirius multifiliis TaxID=5932 RepID=G0QS01_ICHMU|nr:protein phosphatase, putative [Ichthyophthirius multifiliis]EGR32031.1 protein phosphatase, putative [Ichthyophthirius multifiliis]|eukprot:XP_004035517.1 protein phosphatase, putative [Ichthyophthirius multifiliis]